MLFAGIVTSDFLPSSSFVLGFCWSWFILSFLYSNHQSYYTNFVWRKIKFISLITHMSIPCMGISIPGCISVTPWHLSCCFLSTLVLFSGSDYMTHKWVIIPGKGETRVSGRPSQCISFMLVHSMGVLPEISCPVLTSPFSRTKQDWLWTKQSQMTLARKHPELSVLAEGGAVDWKRKSWNCVRAAFLSSLPSWLDFLKTFFHFIDRVSKLLNFIGYRKTERVQHL